MGMPELITFVRHGESEANVFQGLDKQGIDVSTPEFQAIQKRVDYKQRLSMVGIEQAEKAREWLIKNAVGGLAMYDAFFCSTFFRASETAAKISAGYPGITWKLDDRLDERNWGVHSPLTKKEREELYETTSRLMDEDPYHAAFEGGESIWGVKNERFRDWQNTLHREQDGKNVLVVTHGDFMRAARIGIERILPEEFEAIEADPRYKIKNCTILQYSRVNPEDSQDIKPRITYRRMIYPTDIQASPDGGEWIKIGKREFNSEELLDRISVEPRLLG